MFEICPFSSVTCVVYLQEDKPPEKKEEERKEEEKKEEPKTEEPKPGEKCVYSLYMYIIFLLM